VLPPLAVCVVAVLAFLPARKGTFTNWDDDVNITENRLLERGFSDGLLPLLTRPHEYLYVPVTYAAWWTLRHLFGAGPASFHLLNILLHAATALLLYSVFLALFKDWFPAFLAAAWWAVHPVHAETVAWATGLKDVLSLLLVAVSWRLYIAWRERTPSRERPALFAAALLAFLLGCLAKPGVVLFPLVLAAYDRFARKRPWREMSPLLLFLAVSLLVTIVTVAVQAGAESDPAYSAPRNRLFLVADSGLFYLEKSLWPVGLCPVYGRTVWDAAAMPWATLKLGLAAALALLAWLAGPRYRLAGMVFLAGFLPVSGIVPFGYQIYSTVADRYAALPLVGVALALGGLIGLLTPSTPAGRSARAAVCAIVAVWAGLLSLQSWEQTGFWRDSVTLWERVVECNPDPSARVLSNYGSALFKAGRTEEALGVVDQAIENEPTHAQGRYNHGRILQALGRADEAREEYVAALLTDPRHVSACLALSSLEAGTGDFQRAEEAARRASELAPDNPDALFNLGLAILNQGRPAEALPFLARAAALAPHDKEILRVRDLVRNGER
jgi:tetratricopeptide (TPR) repeat protein